MSMFDRSYCATECERLDCDRNLKFYKPATRIYTASKFDSECLDTEHKNCKDVYPMPIQHIEDKITRLTMENNDLKLQLKNYIPRRRVRRVYKELRELLAEGNSEETKKYIKILQDFTRKIETDGDQLAGQEIKAAIQYLLSMRGVD